MPDTQLLGRRVIINGLVAKPQLNGSTGTALTFDDVKGRYSVELDDTSTTIMIKPCNLLPTNTAATPQATSHVHTFRHKDLPTGDAMVNAVADQIERESINHLRSFTKSGRQIRADLAKNGTDLARNDADLFGDGDQQPLRKREYVETHRDIWVAGGDTQEYFGGGNASTMAMACLTGNLHQVQRELRDLTGTQLTERLERRETTLRLSPIFFCLIGDRQLARPPNSPQGQFLCIAKELLARGARPDARDVCGKTVAHYGAGAAATPLTLSIVDLCIEKAKELLRPPLLNMRDRGGTVSLHEVIMSNRTEVAEWQLLRGAAIDIADLDGCTPISMINPLFNPAMVTTFSSAATARKRQEHKERDTCSHCGTGGGGQVQLQACAACHTVKYCSKDCQRAAWKGGHKEQCRQRQQQQLPSSEARAPGTVRLDAPGNTTLSSEASLMCKWQVALPPGVAVNEPFFLKVQVKPAGGVIDPLLIYDKSRTVEIVYVSGRRQASDQARTAGHAELSSKVRQEGALGQKGHFEAYIDLVGDIYVDTTKLHMKKW